MRRFLFLFTGCMPLLSLLPASPANASCGAAFCPINTQWEIQGISQESGLRADLRYEYLDQDQPRHGSDRVDVGEIPQHHDEVRTINRNWLLNLDYGFNESWGVSLTLPFVDRDHTHIHNHHGEQIRDSWDIQGLGDARLLGRYQLRTQPLSLLFGLKLPTGETDVDNDDGEVAERSLQPGTGTTDLLLGAAYRQGAPNSPWSWFVQGLAQQSLYEHDDYRPGMQFLLDVGLRYAAGPKLSLMTQANVLIKGSDHGDEAEPDSSGGEYLFLTPGLSYAATPQVQLYAFYQQPLYQHVDGVQLTADRGFTAGLSARF